MREASDKSENSVTIWAFPDIGCRSVLKSFLFDTYLAINDLLELEHILRPKTGDFQWEGGWFPEAGLFPSDLVGTLSSAYIDIKFSLRYHRS